MVTLNNKQDVIIFASPINTPFLPRTLHTRKLSVIQSPVVILQDYIAGTLYGPRRVLLNSKFMILGGRGTKFNIVVGNPIISHLEMTYL